MAVLALNISTQPYTWGRANRGLGPGIDYVWNTSTYPGGTYTVSAMSKLNNMQTNYLIGSAMYTGRTVSTTKTITLGNSIPSTSAQTNIGVYKDGAWYLDNDGSGTWNAGDKAYSFGAPAGHQSWATGTETQKQRSGSIGMEPGIWTTTVPGHGMPVTKPIVSDHPAGHPSWATGMETQKQRSGSIGMEPGIWTTTVPGHGMPVTKPVVSEHPAGTPGSVYVNGGSKIGIYKDGAWYVDWNGNGVWDAGTDKEYHFGAPGWIPVVGNWNGDATGVKMGVYQNGVWYLDNDGSGTWNAGDRAEYFRSGWVDTPW